MRETRKLHRERERDQGIEERKLEELTSECVDWLKPWERMVKMVEVVVYIPCFFGTHAKSPFLCTRQIKIRILVQINFWCSHRY